MSFKHVFVTRFGIGVLHEGWLDERLKLLQATALPSLAAQTERNFEWWFAVGNDMPPASRRKVEELLAADERFRIVEVDHLREGFVPVREIARLFTANGGLITTRIDDDDLVHTRCVEDIQTAASEVAKAGPGTAVIYNPLGYELHLPRTEMRELELHGPSMGLSVLASGERFVHAYSLHHMRVRTICEEQKLHRAALKPEQPCWVYLRHVLGDSAEGGEAQMSKSAPIQLTDDVYDALDSKFGLDVARFKALATDQKNLSPRVIGRRKTLLDERVQLIGELRELLLKIDRAQGKDDLPALTARKDELYSEYIRLSYAVFDS